MKHFFTQVLIIVLFAIFQPNQSFANKILGGKIDYTVFSRNRDSVTIIITLFEECGPNPICNCNSTTCQIQGDVRGAGGNYAGQNYGSFTLNSVPIIGGGELRDVCQNYQTNCIPCGSPNAGPGSLNGVKELRFVGILNLNRFPDSLCGFTVSYSACCRDSSIQVFKNASNTNFYTELNLSRCGEYTSGYNTEASPVFKVCAGTKTTIPLFRFTTSPNFSSIFKLGKIKSSQNNYVEYNGNFSELNPFPRAEYPAPIDLSRGYLEFTPVGSFTAPVSIDKYQLKVVNGQTIIRDSTRIEFTIQSVNCPANNVPIIRVYDGWGNPLNGNANPIDTVCNGLELCRIYSAYDADPNDTTYFTKIGMGSFGESNNFTRLYDATTRHINGPRFDSIKVCWNELGTLNNLPLFYSLFSNDGRCPIPGKSNFGGKILFDYLGDVSLNKTMNGIKTANLDYYVSQNNQINKNQSIWKIESRPGSDSFITIIGSTINNYVFPDSGLYKIKIGIQMTCGTIWVQKEIYISPIFASISDTKYTSCNTSNDGRIEISGTSMFLPVTYSINDSTYQSSGVFNNLERGHYVIKIKDALNNIESISTNIYSMNKVLQVSLSNYIPNKCKEDSIATFSIQTINGTGPLMYRVDSVGLFSQNNVYSGLKNGSYIVEVKDSVNCYASSKFTVASNSNIKGFAWNIKPVECYGDSNGSMSLGASGQFIKTWYKVDTSSFQNKTIYDGLKKGVYQIQVKDSLNCLDRFVVEIPGSDSTLSLNFDNKQPACFEFNKGEIKLVIKGGTAPFTIYKNQYPEPTFDQTFTNLNPGNYLFTITDKNNCSITKNTTIQQAPPKLNVLSEIDHVSCKEKNIGRIFIIPDGGVGPYMYKLNLDTFSNRREYTNLNAGKYFISIKDNKGCIKIEEVYINEPVKMNLSFVNTAESCNGAKNGTSVVSVSDGVAPFTYMWNGKSSPNLLFNNNLGEGYAKLKVTDSRECIIEDSTYIRRLKPIENNGKICAISVDPLIGKNIIYVTKSNDSAVNTFDIYSRKNLNSPFEYLASLYSGMNNYAHFGGLQTSGFTDYYYVQARDLCGNKTPYSSGLNGINLSITKAGNTQLLSWKVPIGFPESDGFKVYEKTGNNPYQIIANLGSQVQEFSIPIQSNFQKQFMVEMVSNLLCEPNMKLYSNEVFINANSLEENQKVQRFEVYPNPSSGTFKISENAKQNQIIGLEVYQSNGKLIKSFNLLYHSIETEYDVSDLSTGVYYLNITTQNKEHQNIPLFINHK
ncbi:MAG: T9SS type A sorting domain-containing protein [Bacteroidia bacterium]